LKCGIDIVSISRIGKLIQRRGETGLAAIWTQREIKDCKTKDGTLNISSLAARYAAKEAVAKAFGTGFLRHGIRPGDIEIQRNDSGEPCVVLYSASRSYFEQGGYNEIAVSLSHDADTATAMCVIS
jgi:holo-[acyl-carrier protein] synthase